MKLTAIAETTGVCDTSFVDSCNRYCRYRPRPLRAPPTTGTNDVHVASGSGVSPYRTLMATLVPVGASPVHVAAVHVTVVGAERTLDTNAEPAAYGDRCSQSTFSVLASAE
jgi:hypothetical protein